MKGVDWGCVVCKRAFTNTCVYYFKQRTCMALVVWRILARVNVYVFVATCFGVILISAKVAIDGLLK